MIQIQIQMMIHIIDISLEEEIIPEVDLEIKEDLAKLVFIATSQTIIFPTLKNL